MYFAARARQLCSNQGVQTRVGADIDDSHSRARNPGNQLALRRLEICNPQRFGDLPGRIHADLLLSGGNSHRALQSDYVAYLPAQVRERIPQRQKKPLEYRKASAKGTQSAEKIRI
jgi:hypothetical protein